MSLVWVEKQTPVEIMDEAIEKYDLDIVYTLYSGGKDSGCVADWMSRNYPKLFNKGGVIFTNVGLGAQATRKFVLDYCIRRNWKLTMTWPKERENFFHTLLKYGWASPQTHNAWMGVLKQHTWFYHMREAKKRGERAAFISGVRKSESFQRDKIKKYTKIPTNVTSGQVYVKPFLYKNGIQLWNYYNEFEVEKTPVYTWLNRSGECYCGAFLKKWELKLMEKYDPFAFATIQWYEKQIELHGTPKAKRYCRFGGYTKTGEVRQQETLDEYLEGNAYFADGEKIELDEDLCGESCW